MIEVTERGEVENALYRYHLELASVILREVGNFSGKNIVEIGSGPGTFTLPLLEKLGDDFNRFHCVDSYPGPYEQDKKILESKLMGKDKVVILDVDAKEVDKILKDVDLVIGHEVLCDLNLEQIKQIMSACFNVLRNNGLFIHSEFSPFALNESEKMLQTINEFSGEPISDTKWFSPTADELAGLSSDIGFESIKVEYRKIPIKFLGETAIEMVNRWKTKKEFFDKYEGELEKIGIGYPMEQILYCRK